MAIPETISCGDIVRGVDQDGPVEVINIKWFADAAMDLTYKVIATGQVASRLIYPNDDIDMEIVEFRRTWPFDGDGHLFRLVSEARRIRLAHHYDPRLAVHISEVEPLPHQISAVYDHMLKRQPLRFLLADDPGAGKTIMAGLLIRELKIRGDLERCLIVCPGNLAEQWHEELDRKFHLQFDVMTADKISTARTGNWFAETPFVIARLDVLARNEDVQNLLKSLDTEWDMIICDEAHKMSATVVGKEPKYTKRYRLGQMLSGITRNFLLLTATPHNGKDRDFQMFMALLDQDRFVGSFRDTSDDVDVSDMMRRMQKEELYKFDETPLFPERRVYSVSYKLSVDEKDLYWRVSDYVRTEFNRAKAISSKRAGNVGFALTILQRRLASSPEAIYKSLYRRREKLEGQLQHARQHHTGIFQMPDMDEEYLEDLEEAPDDEVSRAEDEILEMATAARTVDELAAEIETLRHLESISLRVKKSDNDRKWQELSKLLDRFFVVPDGSRESFVPSPHQKLVIFTEHKDTLNYLYRKITTLLGRPEAVVTIHGGTPRKARQGLKDHTDGTDRYAIQESFLHNPKVQILLATDAASEGINLQRAHLMVNYDLPWNPNRIEQRFGRIHRIGQTEVCHLWNLVAEDTREGDVYSTLLKKLEEARDALGGKVFDVLGKLQFDGEPLYKLMKEAIFYGERSDVRDKLTQKVSDAFDTEHIRHLLDESLSTDKMDTRSIQRIRQDLERADARRLQPHYIESFFVEAFRRLGGRIRQREAGRYYISHVPYVIRSRSAGYGGISRQYQRVTFDKSLVSADGHNAAFVHPGHPLLDTTIDLILERYGDVFEQSTILVDDNDYGEQPHILVYLEHDIVEDTRTVSSKVLYVSITADSVTGGHNYAPYLDYRPLNEGEPDISEILDRPECSWIGEDLGDKAVEYAVLNLVPEHMKEIQSYRLDILEKTEHAVKTRLSKEITYWDRQAYRLKGQKQAGKPGAGVNLQNARRRADELEVRLDRRVSEIERQRHMSSRPPVVKSGVLVIPIGLVHKMRGNPEMLSYQDDRMESAARARAAVMKVERDLGYIPIDREADKVGYDIESQDPDTGRLRFIEVKGRNPDAPTITVTRNEILTCRNKPHDYILAIVLLEDDHTRVCYVREPFGQEPDFGVTSVNYDMSDLLKRSEVPS